MAYRSVGLRRKGRRIAQSKHRLISRVFKGAIAVALLISGSTAIVNSAVAGGMKSPIGRTQRLPISLYVDTLHPSSFSTASFGAASVKVEGGYGNLYLTVIVYATIPEGDYNPEEDVFQLHVSGGQFDLYEALPNQSTVTKRTELRVGEGSVDSDISVSIPFSNRTTRFSGEDAKVIKMAGRAVYPKEYVKVLPPKGAPDDFNMEVDYSGNVWYSSAARFRIRTPRISSPSLFSKTVRLDWDPSLGRLTPMNRTKGLEEGLAVS